MTDIEYIQNLINSTIKDETRDKTYCYDTQEIVKSLKTIDYNDEKGFYNKYVKDKPFNKKWWTFIISIINYNKLYGINNSILNEIFKNFNKDEYIDDVKNINNIINISYEYIDNKNYKTYITKYTWLRKNIENGFIVTDLITDNINTYNMLYDELTLVHFQKKGTKDPWQNQKFINKLYSAEYLITKMFISKHLFDQKKISDQKKIDKFINLSENLLKKHNTQCFKKDNIIHTLTYLMINNNDYFNEHIIILFLLYYDNHEEFYNAHICDIIIKITPQMINDKLKREKKIIDVININNITNEYNVFITNRNTMTLINNIYKLNITEFKKIKIDDILQIFSDPYNKKMFTMDMIYNIYDGIFTDEDYYKIIFVSEFTEEILKKINDKLITNSNITKKIFKRALQVDNKIIIKYFLDNKYNVTNEDILNTSDYKILQLYKDYNFLMDKDTLYKYYRKYNYGIRLSNLICYTEYHNHPEDFKEIEKEIELNKLELLITNNFNKILLITELNENKPIITLDMIIYLASDTTKKILYDYYLQQQK